ncbi:MAG: tetratricopeptide repeat protein [Cyanobacteria bacterium P01_D01_bin.105]
MCPSQPAKETASISVYSGSSQSRTDSWLSDTDANFLLKKQAELAMQQKDYERALRLLNRLMVYEPDKAEHYNNLGLIYYAIKQWKKAEANYNWAIALNPDQDRTYNNRANLYAVRQNWADAIADYDTAIDLNPLNIRARLNQAITFREMGEYEEALVCLDVALIFVGSSDRDNFLIASIYAERGRTHHLQGSWNCALADYKAVLSLSMNDAITHRVIKWSAALTQPYSISID